MNIRELQAQDLKLNWHPCAQMHDYENFKALVIKRAYGSYLELADGRKIIDAISSWWCKALGHNHPLLKKALLTQVRKFEHVIFANTTNEIIVKLSRKLTELSPGLSKVFYAGDGSSAVEVAIKMSLHVRKINKQAQKNKFVAFTNGYHGETVGALSVSDSGVYRDPYQDILFTPILITPPYVCGAQDPRWHNAFDAWCIAEKILEQHKKTITAIILEPILQGAGGMQLYSKDFLARLSAWAKNNDVYIIADEIMTGIGRTGKMFACEHADIKPDFICLSKGLTSGWLPFSAVLMTEKIYQTFYGEYELGKNFLHSHTYSGNVLGAAIALKTIEIIEENKLYERANLLQTIMLNYMQEIAAKTKILKNIRGIGAVIAADLIVTDPTKRVGYQLYKNAVEYGAFLRPLGNTIYWLPPLNIPLKTLRELRDITLRAILKLI